MLLVRSTVMLFFLKFSVLGWSGMELIRYYGKGKNFNSIGRVKKRENSDRKNCYFINLCRAAFTMIEFLTFFSYSASIHFKPVVQLRKKYFLCKRNIGLKYIKHIPKENHYNKSWFCFFFKNRQEQLMWQKINHE